MSKDTIDKNGFLTSAGIERRISPCLSPKGNNHLLGVTDDGQVIGFNVDGQKANRNVLVVGQAGTGKGYNYILPNLLNMKESAVVLTRGASAVYGQYREYFERNGCMTHFINWDNPAESSRFNPFLYCHRNDNSNKRLLVNSIVEYLLEVNEEKNEDPFHMSVKNRILRLVVNHLVDADMPDEERSFKTIYNIIKDIANRFRETPDFISASIGYFSPDDAVVKTLECCHERDISAALIDLLGKVQIFTRSEFECFVERSDTDNVDIENFQYHISYLFIEGSLQKPVNKLIGFMIQQLLSAVSFNVDKEIRENTYYDFLTRKYGTENWKPQNCVRFYLDEFHNYSFPDIYPFILFSGGNGYSFSFIVQNVANNPYFSFDNSKNDVAAYYSLDNPMTDIADPNKIVSLYNSIPVLLFLGTDNDNELDYIARHIKVYYDKDCEPDTKRRLSEKKANKQYTALYLRRMKKLKNSAKNSYIAADVYKEDMPVGTVDAEEVRSIFHEGNNKAIVCVKSCFEENLPFDEWDIRNFVVACNKIDPEKFNYKSY